MRRQLPDLLARHWTQLALLLLGVLGPLLLFTDLAGDVVERGGFAWDRTVLTGLAARRTPGLTWAAEALSALGGLWGLARAGARAHAWFLVGAVVGGAALNVLAKLTFQRPRPTNLGALLTEPGFSFPSGHAMSNMAFGYALTLLFWHTRWRWPVAALGFGWGLAVGLSRIYLGVHYPSDVLAGFAASVAWVAGLYLILGRRWPALRRAPGAAHSRG